MTPRNRKFPCVLCLSVVVSSIAGASAEPWQYYYFDQPQPLSLDVRQIAVFAPEGAVAAKTTASLTKKGIAASDIERSAVPRLSMIGTTAIATDEAAVTSLVESLAQDPSVGFVSPVFRDSRDLPLMIMEHLNVGFYDHIDGAQAEAILKGAGAGSIVQRDWADMPGVYRLASPTRNGIELLALANSLAQRPEVKFAEPDLLMTGRLEAVIPNDPQFPNQWGLHNTGQSGGTVDVDMDAPEAWDITMGDPDVIVVIMDTGAQQDHPDLNQIPGADFTGQGTDGGPGNSCDGHGTTTSGTVSAIINNALDTTGVAPHTRTASARVFVSNVPCNGFGSVASTWVVNALSWAESLGARVTNASIGMPGVSTISVKYQTSRDNGIVHFTSSGNSGAASLSYPATLSTVEAVGAINRFGNRATFSQFGTGLAFSAPGVSIFTADETGLDGFCSGDVCIVDGTSYASPYSAGVAALVLATDRTLWPDGVVQIMADSAVDLGSSGYDTVFGWGLVNARGAVEGASGPVQRCEVAHLVSPVPGAGDAFGDSVGISDAFAIVGEPQSDAAGANAGSVQMFQRAGSTYTHLETLTALDATGGALFGDSVAIRGDVAVVGSPGSADFGANTGAAYVFRWSGVTWVQEQKLLAADASGGDFLGAAVSIDGDIVVAGARVKACADASPSCGAAYVFRYSGSSWAQEAKLTSSDAASADLFGSSVSVSGNAIAVGATFADCLPSIANCGAGYVYRFDGLNWNEEAKLSAADPAIDDSLGGSIAISGDDVVAGASRVDCSNGDADCGAAYFFHHDFGVWSQSSKIAPSDLVTGSSFGTSVALEGGRAVIGSSGARCGIGQLNCGTAYSFNDNGVAWTRQSKFLADAPASNDQFGQQVAVSGGMAMVGAARVDCGAGNDCGAAVVYGAAGDCNLNGVDDFCDIRDGTSLDDDLDGEPDECSCLVGAAPLAEKIGPDDSIKNRYLSFTAGDGGASQAIRVTLSNLPPPNDGLNGRTLWVGPPSPMTELPGLNDDTAPTFNAARLQCDPFYTDWSLQGVVHVSHEVIVPGSTYDLQTIDEICIAALEASYSLPLPLNTSSWGDVVSDCSTMPCGPPNGVVGVPTDVVSILDKFSSLPGAPIKARCDIEPAILDGKITIVDVSRAVDAFRGATYPFPQVTLSCP